MERLTKRHYVEKNDYYLKCSEGKDCPNNCEECDRLDDAIARLGAYEDTGLGPDQIESMYMKNKELVSLLCKNGEDRVIELVEADMEGRVVILPCKSGDTVWILQQRGDGSCCVRKAEFWWSDIPQVGKTVFLTREEAERVLEEME